jgi:hypothetical protein
MSRPILELENLLPQLVAEYSRLAAAAQRYQLAMRALDTAAMDALQQEQERLRMRLAQMEVRRRATLQSIARFYKLDHLPTLSEIASLDAGRAGEIRRLQKELREVTARLQRHTSVSQRLAGALLGHLNGAVKLFAGVTQQPSTYTRHGGPKITGRIGGLEAVG